MNYWIFQGNPDIFDVTEYVAKNDDIVWSVRQRHLLDLMKPGDEVFIWRAGGKKKGIAGVVAVAHLVGEPRMTRDDSASHPYWKLVDSADVEMRVQLKVEKRCFGVKETIRREWIKEDDQLKGLRILRMGSATNCRITAAQAKRLAMLCRSAGSDWSREEDIAALWAFKESQRGSVSRSSDSPVAQVAALIGRPIGAVYNKVMNFRHIDPRDPRVGLPNVSQVDRDVWAEFSDPVSTSVDSDALDREFRRVWRQDHMTAPLPRGYTDFGEAPDDDPSDLARFATEVRKGQPRFHAKLRELYDDRCAVSGWGPHDVLEAAHIYAHAESGVNHSSNGILIRADLHY